jgi:hypothetical protein
MSYENQILDALLFLDWDLPEETLPEAWADQIKLMAGADYDEFLEHLPDTH